MSIFTNWDKRFWEQEDKRLEEYITESDLIKEKIKELTKKYQDRPDTFIKDYDEVIKDALIGIISNFKITTVVRSDIINDVTTLISIRELVEQYSKKSG